MNTEELEIRNIIDIKKWQSIQDSFSAITELGLRIVDPKGSALTLPSGEPRLCRELLNDQAMKNRFCGRCLPTFLGGKGVVDRNLNFVTCAGMHNCLAPLKVENKVFAYLVMGPVILVWRKTKEQYASTADDLGLELDDLWNALLEIKVVSFNWAQSLMEFIRDIFEYILKLSYQATFKTKEAVSVDILKLNRILEVLLDAAFQISGADIGSVMFLDEGKNKLTIRASKGLSDEVVRTTNIGLEEGVSGIALKEKASLLIDDNLKDNRVKRYLHRPYISSSMIIPIKIKSEMQGVINLGTLASSSVKFNLNSMNLINRIVDLASVALHS